MIENELEHLVEWNKNPNLFHFLFFFDLVKFHKKMSQTTVLNDTLFENSQFWQILEYFVCSSLLYLIHVMELLRFNQRRSRWGTISKHSTEEKRCSVRNTKKSELCSSWVAVLDLIFWDSIQVKMTERLYLQIGLHVIWQFEATLPTRALMHTFTVG